MKKLTIALILGILTAGSAFAAELGDVDIHGFISQGYMQTNENNFLADTQDGTFEFNEMGINFTTWLLPGLRAGVQLFAKDLGPVGNDEIKVDWAYGDYRYKEWLGIRAGILKIPYGFYNETRDVDLLRTSIFLPQSVYAENFRDPSVKMKGGGVYGDISMGKGGTLTYKAQFGTLNVSNDGGTARSAEGGAFSGGISLDVNGIDVEQKYVAQLQWATPLEGLRIGASVTDTKLETQYTLTDDYVRTIAGQSVTLANSGDTGKSYIPKLIQTVYSVEYIWEDLIFSGEYFRQNQDKVDEVYSSATVTIVIPGVGPVAVPVGTSQINSKQDSEGYYGNVSYRINEWLELGSYYSAFFNDRSARETTKYGYLKDWALSTRFDINEYWIVKLEGHLMRGGAFLNNLDNLADDGTTILTRQDDWDPTWFLYAAKITYTF